LCDLSGFESLLQELAEEYVTEKIINIAAKKAAKTAVFKAALFFVDGPFPVGDVISAAWMAADAASLASQISNFRDYARVIYDGVTDLRGLEALQNLDPLDKCCDELKERVGTIIRSGISKRQFFNAGNFNRAFSNVRSRLNDCLCISKNKAAERRLSPTNYPNPDPAMSVPPVRYEPTSLAEVERMRRGKGPTTRATHGTDNIEAHHRQQVPISQGGVMDELTEQTHRRGGNHTRHDRPSQLTPAQPAKEISDHYRQRGSEYIMPGEGI
jgi:hypothetical protein